MIPVEPTESAAERPGGSFGDFEIEDISVGPYAHGFGRSEGELSHFGFARVFCTSRYTAITASAPYRVLKT